ncbi:N-acetylmuramoyl-L-alanine amidase [Corynebacterium accolens]|uniref:peptidoglycan recognition protein family protein n=1 Tax=Corynebacterium accolens TaxID=38284 RepID=UPI00266FFB40|nr:peptidoglycan recognition family protein [Corynebacterium accolens]WKS69758.1 N-acetylmuramoyl-L-alanine amidase [Corynebacterium accolens]WKS72035.1 N-acetylmuramoyl-L-alanine amidase [Corynebacterium accolens]WKS74359.1 N-acetylmuramoyl-L-alanine amidase [Corynebacterium accolens]
MKNFYNLESDEVRLMNKHFTQGRNGQRVQCVVIHHNAGVLSIKQIWDVWQTRAASAHFQTESGGRIGQLVWDANTAWHAANAWINQTSIGIEVSNSAGPNQDWPITDTAVIQAARLAAAVCWHFKLGRPVAGKNVRWHREFTGTSCPYHLAPGGKYHRRFMDEAHRFYDLMAAGAIHPNGALKQPGVPAPQPRKEPKDVLTIKYFTDFITGFIGPVISDVKDIRQQLTGGRDGGQYGGWSISQLVKNYQSKPGDNGTVPEMMAVALTELEKMRNDLDELKKNGAK